LYFNWEKTSEYTGAIDYQAIFDEMVDWDGDSQQYYSTFTGWKVAMTSTANPLESIGLNSGICTLVGSAESPILIQENVKIKNQTADEITILEMPCLTVGTLYSTSSFTIKGPNNISDFGTQAVVVATIFLNPANTTTILPVRLFNQTNTSGSGQVLLLSFEKTKILVQFQIWDTSAATSLFYNQLGLDYPTNSWFNLVVNIDLVSQTILWAQLNKASLVTSTNTLPAPITYMIYSSSSQNLRHYVNFEHRAQDDNFPNAVRYLAYYDAATILAHPEIDWSDGAAFEDYFYNTGTNELKNNLYNAVPGIQPWDILDANVKRGQGIFSNHKQWDTVDNIASDYAIIQPAPEYNTNSSVSSQNSVFKPKKITSPIVIVPIGSK
jgi:hypothetical protein